MFFSFFFDRFFLMPILKSRLKMLCIEERNPKASVVSFNKQQSLLVEIHLDIF